MENDAARFFEKFKTDMPKMKEMAPDAAAGMGKLFQKVMKDGALTVREKELVALGMGIVLRCVPCINLHVKKSLEAGATKEEILEVAGVAVMMQGGPGYTYIPMVIDALDAIEG